MKFFGREPALWLMAIASAIQMVSAFAFPLSGEQQGVLNAAVAALAGVAIAWSVAREKLLPALTGALTALIAVGAAFGFDLSAEAQGALMAFITAAAGFLIRDRVVAPVDETGAYVVTTLPSPSAAGREL